VQDRAAGKRQGALLIHGQRRRGVHFGLKGAVRIVQLATDLGGARGRIERVGNPVRGAFENAGRIGDDLDQALGSLLDPAEIHFEEIGHDPHRVELADGEELKHGSPAVLPLHFSARVHVASNDLAADGGT
jgi:hypothetical protein